MGRLTPIGSRLSTSLDAEYSRMQNEWFFKWHFIGAERLVEIDSFNGKPICYGGIRFSGSAQQVYWYTIQLYLQKKVGLIFDELEQELTKYPLGIRCEALSEAQRMVTQFATKIRKAAVEKDRVLRGNGITFPPEHDQGHWIGCGVAEIEARVSGLRQIYCDLPIDVGGIPMPFSSLTTDRLTLVKKNGTVVRSEIPATVSSGRITTFAADLPIEVGDSLLRHLPNGLVENFIVDDPGYHSGIAGAIQPHYQVKVHRSDAPVTSQQHITANFHGPNSRMNIQSIDNSVNAVSGIKIEELTGFITQIRANLPGLPSDQQKGIADALVDLEAEVAKSAPSQPRISSLLQSMKTIAEGAAGNLVASGIVALIRSMLGS